MRDLEASASPGLDDEIGLICIILRRLVMLLLLVLASTASALRPCPHIA